MKKLNRRIQRLLLMQNNFIFLAVFGSLASTMQSCQMRRSNSVTPRESQSELQSAFDPHKLSARGPWFEGWYLRISSPEAKESFGVIVGSYQAKKLTGDEGRKLGLPGYVAILASQGQERLIVAEAFPSWTQMTIDGQPVLQDPDRLSAANFLWEARSDGVSIAQLTADKIEVNLPSGERFSAKLGSRLPFDSSEFGPGGLVTFIRQFPLQWFIQTLGSDAEFFLSSKSRQWGSAERPLHGYAHYEKNWGMTFPRGYAWLEAIDATNNAQLAVAGGALFKAGILEPQAWLATFKVGGEQWSFAPQKGAVLPRSHVQSCAGKMTLELDGLKGRLYLEAAAPRKSFAPIHIPTEQGFIPGSEQSFATTMRARILPLGASINASGQPSQTPLADVTFDNAALEFGGQYKCAP